MTGWATRLALLVSLALLASSCSSDGAGDTVTVLAAASLTDAFDDLAAAYSAATGIEIELVTAGSSTLATQLREGAPADVVALADPQTMERVSSTARVEAAAVRPFARNHLVLAVPEGNPAGITGIDDLGGRLLAVCAPQVPCGRLASELAVASGVALDATTEEPNVRSVRTKVQLGEVDAGLIYVTDLVSEVEAIEVPNAGSITTSYPVAAVDRSLDGQRFVEFVLSPAGLEIMAEHGFGAP